MFRTDEGWLKRTYRGSAIAAGRRYLGQPKVQDLGMPTLRDEYVRGLDVAMNNACRMRGVQCVRDLHRHRQQRLQLHRPARD